MSTGCKSSHSGFLDVNRSNGGLRWVEHIKRHFLRRCAVKIDIYIYIKDIRLDWPTFMFDDFLHQLVSGSLPS